MRNFEYFCNDFEKIENYEAAKADNFKGWVCHHRLGLIATGGVCDVESQDLIDWGIYYNRPADELIFLTRKEHTSLHRKCKTHSEETKKRMSEAQKGRPGPNTGRQFSTEWRTNMSDAMKGEKNPFYGKTHSEETKYKISESMKGKHWRIVNDKRIYY